MHILLSILSLLLVLPAIGGETTTSLKDEENDQQVEDISIKHPSIFHSYPDCLQSTRQKGLSTLIVLYSDENTVAFQQLFSMAINMEESVLSKYANFTVLSPTGINLLIYPPVPDPMLAEIARFKELFPEVKDLKGTYLITLSISDRDEKIMDIAPIDLPEEDSVKPIISIR
ncbi:hypothetical protein [Chlamydia buteonis]|uniref:Uncharacterized protein n=1 Tax=Chlamydia buteonis TaxID=2494525 RepID=A0ABX8LB11_9CHLA|nr:hypothetical protein [Chlamydia buteonis]QXE26826.1 hypothetical protein HBN95_01435 [Chlamydia buteonis]QXE28225.1 hypothetical protein JJJ19_01710 [Chlamydia buteonis]